MCNSCIHNLNHCQFSDFLKGDEYYVKDEKGDCYCLFHAPKELKDKFTYAQNELFLKTIDEYIDATMKQAHTVNFSNVIFHLPITISNKNASILDFYFETLDEYRIESNVKIDFTNAVFYEYVDIRNIKCKELVFEDTKFLKGGALKNRGGINNLYIEYLIFKPFVVESDFVIDIGGYANEDGKIEVDAYGTIKNTEFENHKEGKGVVYFIGLNQYVEKADFRNRNLDLVSFQNCDLSKCYFLNAKVDKTEFRNCKFPQGYVYETYELLRGFARYTFLTVIVLTIVGIIVDTKVMIYKHKWGEKFMSFFSDYLIFFIISFPFWVLGIFKIFADFTVWVESKLAKTDIENSKHGIHTLNPFKFIGRHFSIADEVRLYETINKQKIDIIDEKKRILDTFTALAATYIQLKNNFSRYDYQMEGSFFYAQRYFEALSSRNKDQTIERWVLITHHFINGFGERFMKPVFWFLLTGILFAGPAYIGIGYFSIVKKEGIFATEATPKFLLDSNSSRLLVEYKDLYLKKEDINEMKLTSSYILLKDSNLTLTRQTYFAPKLKEDFSTALVYSFSRFVSPLTSQTKAWFKTEGGPYIFLSYLETVLLYLFFGAFLLALKNRIKR